jgi:hypothetical protein
MSNELTEAEQAIHLAICEGAPEDCKDWRGRCIKAADAVTSKIEAEALYDAADRYLDLSDEDRRYPADLMRTWAAEKLDKIKG